MNLIQDLFSDLDLPVVKEDTGRTSQLDLSQVKTVELTIQKANEVNGKANAMKIALYLPHRRWPIVLRNRPTITVGRADRERNVIPTLDLSTENASVLGVSRLHAKILYIEGRFFLKDMGSTNGTWLDQRRLAPYEIVPLASKDQIRLGRFVMMVA